MRVCLLALGVVLRECLLVMDVVLRVCLLEEGGEDVGRLSPLLFLQPLRAFPCTEMGGMEVGLQVRGWVGDTL